MADLISFLNTNAGVLNLLFSALVAISTVVYAWLTARLVREARSMREAQTEPRIEVFYRPRDEWISLIDVVVKNIGTGPAYAIFITASASHTSEGSSSLLQRLNELGSFRKGIAFLAPGQEFHSFWTTMTEHFEDKLQTSVVVKSRFRSSSGREYEARHQLDLSELKGVQRIGTPALLKIAKAVEKLQEDVNRLVAGLRKMKVDVFTSEDRERELAEWTEERVRLLSQEKAPGGSAGAP
jgi:hypothetical protein